MTEEDDTHDLTETLTKRHLTKFQILLVVQVMAGARNTGTSRRGTYVDRSVQSKRIEANLLHGPRLK